MAPEEIRDRRWRLMLKQSDLAKLVGVSTISISSWECGKATPSEKNLKKLKEVLGVGHERS